MNAFSYWPYDEVTIDCSGENLDVIVKTPWLEASTNRAAFKAEELNALTLKINEQRLAPEDLPILQNFFQHFHRYPLAYILPTPKIGSSLDSHLLCDHSLLNGDIKNVLHGIFSSFPCSELEEQ